MRKKVEITKENYKEMVLKKSIIICWILLVICLLIKLCGGNFFNIVCETEEFIKFCSFCDTSFIRYVIYFAYFMFESAILLLIIRPDLKITSKRFIIYMVYVLAFWIVKVLYDVGIIKTSIIIANIFPLIILYFLLMIFSKRPIMSFIIIIYQTVLALLYSFIKSISLTGTLSDSFLLYFIFNIDYYILLIITLLYAKLKFKKEK